MDTFQHWYDLFAVISRPKAGVFRHIGILLPDGRVAHCAPGRGEHISTVDEFAAGQNVTIVRSIAAAERVPILRRIDEAMRSPKAYDAAMNNCEMFVNRVTREKPESPQLQGIILLASFALLAACATR